MSRPRDSQRSRVYAWEREIKGYHRAPEWQRLEEVEAFLAPIWRAERGRYGRASMPMPEIARPNMGQRRALAYADSHRITLPRWARQGPVVLHEAAHCLTPTDEGHGPRFVGVLIGLLARHLDYDAGELMALADEMGVRYHVRSVGVVPVHNLTWRLRRLLREDRPMTEMDLACELDVSYLQVRAAAMGLIRTGQARWLRRKLVPLGDLLPAPPPAPAPRRRARQPGPTSTRGLAELHGITIEREGPSWLVWPPSSVDDDRDPFAGDHLADDWAEVGVRVRRYVAVMAPVATD